MTDICTMADTSEDGSSAQIRASRSDLSIANSSPRLESNATTSTACINDEVPLRRDLSTELLCPLCDQLFDRPVMVTCGHSYCESCIERHTRQTRSCVICKHDVGPFNAMIPSIVLHNMVKKLKSQEVENSSYDDLFICEEKLQKQSAQTPVIPAISQKVKRRLTFSVDGPTICSSPITPHRRRPLSPSARPIKSSLKIQPESLNFELSPHYSSPGSVKNLSYNEESIVAGASLFVRNSFGRRSERFTSATSSQTRIYAMNECLSPAHLDSTIQETNESGGEPMKRNSFFRRSLNAIRSKTGRGSIRKSMNFKVIDMPDAVPEDSEVLLTPEKKGDGDEVKKSGEKSSMKSLWKRLFLTKKSKDSGKVHLIRHEQNVETVTSTISFVRLENQLDDPPEPHRHLLNSHFALGYYTGIGRKFERIASGSEITLVVFGHTMAGKTTFVRSIRQLFLEGTDRIRVIPVAERYRLAGIGMMPFPEGDNRLPHIVSLVINNDADDVEYVLDIIDPEYDNSNLPEAYMNSCDAAILLIDARNRPSLLSAHQIQRNMKSVQHAPVQCELILNIPSDASGQTRDLSMEELEKTMARKAKELCVRQLDRPLIEEMLLSLCERVSAARKPGAINAINTSTTSSNTSTLSPQSSSSSA